MKTYQEAYAEILNLISPLSPERVPLLESSGRILREDIFAPHDLPPFALSAKDGYAVKSADTLHASTESPIELKVTDYIPAGKISTRRLSTGEAMRIFTGAPIPHGADAVIMQEYTASRGEQVLLHKPVVAGDDIRSSGEDVLKGSLVISKGRYLRPGEIEMLGALGFYEVLVGKKPQVAILSTGDEITPINAPLIAGKVRNGNQYAIAAAIQQSNGIPLLKPYAVPDNEEKIQSAILEFVDNGADLILTIGGVSVGDYDLTRKVIEQIGKIELWRVAIQPGKPLAFGFVQEVPFFGLPGFPVSCLVMYAKFVKDILWKMQGRTPHSPARFQAILDEPIQRKDTRMAFYRGIALMDEHGQYHVKPTGPQGSGIISSLVKANVFIILPIDVTEFTTGSMIEIEFPGILNIPD